MSKPFIVWPKGRFDGNARQINAEHAGAAAIAWAMAADDPRNQTFELIVLELKEDVSDSGAERFEVQARHLGGNYVGANEEPLPDRAKPWW